MFCTCKQSGMITYKNENQLHYRWVELKKGYAVDFVQLFTSVGFGCATVLLIDLKLLFFMFDN